MKALISLAALILSSLHFPTSSLQQDSIAHVTAIKGTVILQRGRDPEKRIDRTTFLREGDVIKTGSDGNAWLYQAYSRAQQLKPNELKPIKRLAPSTGPGVIDADKYAKLATLAASSLADITRKSPGKMGGPDELVVIALAPRESLVLEVRPIFEWTAVKNAKVYEFALYDSKQDKPVWQTTTKEPLITYPDHNKDKSVRPLSPGSYTWEVTAKVDQDHKAYAAADFIVATDAEAKAALQALKAAEESVSDNDANNLLYIQACFEYKLYPKAEAKIIQALKRTPDDIILWALLMQAYENMKRYEDRNRVFDYLKEPKPADLEKILGGGTPTVKK